jgi:hypothetical protein
LSKFKPVRPARAGLTHTVKTWDKDRPPIDIDLDNQIMMLTIAFFPDPFSLEMTRSIALVLAWIHVTWSLEPDGGKYSPTGKNSIFGEKNPF